MLTVSSAFALFLMLAIASLVYFVSLKHKLPYTVLLTFVGVLLVPLSFIHPLGFLREFQLTPEILFYIFLPILIFESGYNMNIRRIVEEAHPIMLLAVVGYLVSAFTIGGVLYLIFGWLHLSIPFLITLLFGALISATDPVAVLALFKEFGAPRRLSLIFEGESLMNDATALALFIIILGLIEHGISGVTLGAGAITFFVMLIGGAFFGLLFGAGISKLIGLFRENEFIAVALMIVLAHLSFLSAEYLNELFHESGIGFIQLSPIIATTFASIVMGNYGRYKVTPRAEEFVEKFWSHFAFLANSIVFILVGLFVASIPVSASALLIPIGIAVVVVAAARALSIYVSIIPFNLFVSAKEKIPNAWQHILAWGSLRGALAVMLVFLIPENLSIPNWAFELSPREFLLVLTIACIFTTLFIKAPFVGSFMKRLKVGSLTPLEKAAFREAELLIHGTTLRKLALYTSKGYVPETVNNSLTEHHMSVFTPSVDVADVHRDRASEQTLHMYMIGHEKAVLKELFAFDEMTEDVFRRIYGKLTLQGEAVESGDLHPNTHETRDYRDIFENAAVFLRKHFTSLNDEQVIRDQYLYYRSQEIIAHKALKELASISELEEFKIFTPEVIERAKTLYKGYENEARGKRDTLLNTHGPLVNELDETLALRSAYRVEEKLLNKLYHRGFLTPKLYITLKEKYEKNMHSRKIAYKKR